MPDETKVSKQDCMVVVPVPKVEASIGFRFELEHYTEEARSIPKGSIRVCRVNTDVMAMNVRRGVNSISSPEIIARIHKELPLVNVESLLDLPRLSETVAHVARTVAPAGKSSKADDAYKRGVVLRRRLFDQIEVLICAGLVDADEFNPLRKGRGKVDLATDLIDAVALFARHAPELRGKISVTPEMLSEAESLGSHLREKSVPQAAKNRPSDARSGAAETRDLLWTLLCLRHKDLRRVATWLWHKEADEMVPPLCSRAYKRKK
ncbi:MAG TPA: hypothetical protein DFS52_12350 [Myxococcales bacterium]|jgi:hypothetical protein|nr:hypothetical protein [Myxococcales bacterium]